LLALPFKGLTQNMQETQTEVEEILIPLSGDEIKAKKVGPVRGMSMNSVKAKFGEPQKVHQAKGKPPITRWDYPEFIVVFESNSVIHTINRAKPAS